MRWVYSVVACVALLAAPPIAFASGTAGTLDPTFNPSGEQPGTVVGPSGASFGIAMQGENLVQVGIGPRDETTIARHAPTGVLLSETKLAPGVLTPVTIATTPEGKIVFAVSQPSVPPTHPETRELALYQLDPDGTLDSSFGKAGSTVLPVDSGGEPIPSSIAIQPDGKIVVGGYARYSTSNPTDQEIFLARFDADGSLDQSFNGSGPTPGIVTFHAAGAERSFVVGMALQPDGKIVTVGDVEPTLAAKSESLVMRFDPNGELDSSFNPGGATPGVELLSLGPKDTSDLSGVAVQKDGRIVAVGTIQDGNLNSNANAFGVVRLDPNGALDETFDAGGPFPGEAITLVGDSEYPIPAGAGSVIIDDQEKIVVGGDALRINEVPLPNFQVTNAFALVRYNANGTLDGTFDPEGETPGEIITQIGDSNPTNSEGASLGGIAKDGGDIVAGGYAYLVPKGQARFEQVFAAARYFDEPQATNLTSTAVRCPHKPVRVGKSIKCKLTVTDNTKGSRTAPAGAVQVRAHGADSSRELACTLVPPARGKKSKCTVEFSLAETGVYAVTGVYVPSDDLHVTSTGEAALEVVEPKRR